MTDNALPSLITQALAPGVRLRALTELLDRPHTDAEVRALRVTVPHEPPVSEILAAQYPAGYWMHPGLGISPHYRATAWQLLFLAQLGMPRTPAVERAVDVLLEQNRDDTGAFRLHKGRDGRSLALTGALLWALARLDFAGDPRLSKTWTWVTDRLHRAPPAPPAATWCLRAAVVWGRDALAHCLIPHIKLAALLDELTFPLVLVPDRLAGTTALAEAGRADAIPPSARAWLREKKTPQGWPLERVPGPLWWEPGLVDEPNPWVTLRALYVERA